MLKSDQLGRVLRMQESLGLTGVHYFGHGHEPSNPRAQAEFHARRLGLPKDDPAAASAGTNGLVRAHLRRAVATGTTTEDRQRDKIMTREFWLTAPVTLTKPEMK